MCGFDVNENSENIYDHGAKAEGMIFACAHALFLPFYVYVCVRMCVLLDFFCETTHVYASKTESRNSVDFFLKFRQFYVLNCFVSNSFITGGYLDYVHP